MTVDERVEAARRLLRERRIIVEPDPHFADRVAGQLRANENWMFAWAARRVLPATLAVAAALTVAIFVTGGLPGGPASSSGVLETQSGSDPLDWLLDAPEGRH